jgi:putative transferase (TIGR04331 family)
LVARFLITTADERSWSTDRPVLFLGEWCRLFNRRDQWKRLDAKVVPYHWDDRRQLYQDYLYVRQLCEQLLAELSDALNSFHEVRHSPRYWRILIGPWLHCFTQVLFDRWTMIQHVTRDYQIEATTVLDFPPDQVVANDMSDFMRKVIDDVWNHAIYSRILEGWTSVRCDHLAARVASQPSPPPPSTGSSHTRLLRRAAARSLAVLSKAICQPTDAFFISTYLPVAQDFKLQSALGQLPARWTPPQVPVAVPDRELRAAFQLDSKAHKNFEQCIRTLIAEQLPTAYLEGFRALQKLTASLPWPRTPRVVFTSNSHDADDVFKAWAACKVEQGSKLVIGQHGGHYGSGLWSSPEDHELTIADRYLTWGWSEENAKEFPVGVLRLRRRSTSWDAHGGILLVTGAVPRFSYWMYSVMVAGQTVQYFEDQMRFAGALLPEHRDQLLVRLYSLDYGWSQSARWQERYPDIRLDDGKDPIEPLIRRSRLFVATYNATSYLETLSRNIPTIMFWNPHHWELRPSARPYFDYLRTAGILHDTPETAAKVVAKVWNDVDDWWHQPERQDARRAFCDRFARTPEDVIGVLKTALTTISPN